MPKRIKEVDEYKKVELEAEVVKALNEIGKRLEDAQATVESLETSLKAAKAEQGQLESELIELLGYAEQQGKWIAETQERVISITLYSQQKSVSWKSLYDLVYGKLNAQTKKVVDEQVEALKEAAGLMKKRLVKVLKKEGSMQKEGNIWAIIQQGWESLKTYLIEAFTKLKTALMDMIRGSAEIDSTLTEIEAVIAEAPPLGTEAEEAVEEMHLAKMRREANEQIERNRRKWTVVDIMNPSIGIIEYQLIVGDSAEELINNMLSCLQDEHGMDEEEALEAVNASIRRY